VTELKRLTRVVQDQDLDLFKVQTLNVSEVLGIRLGLVGFSGIWLSPWSDVDFNQKGAESDLKFGWNATRLD